MHAHGHVHTRMCTHTRTHTHLVFVHILVSPPGSLGEEEQVYSVPPPWAPGTGVGAPGSGVEDPGSGVEGPAFVQPLLLTAEGGREMWQESQWEAVPHTNSSTEGIHEAMI